MGVEGNKKKNQDGDLEGAAKHDTEPDYKKCITISTEASLKKMVAPGILVLASPLVAGFIFGPPAVSGLLAGIIYLVSKLLSLPPTPEELGITPRRRLRRTDKILEK